MATMSTTNYYYNNNMSAPPAHQSQAMVTHQQQAAVNPFYQQQQQQQYGTPPAYTASYQYPQQPPAVGNYAAPPATSLTYAPPQQQVYRGQASMQTSQVYSAPVTPVAAPAPASFNPFDAPALPPAPPASQFPPVSAPTNTAMVTAPQEQQQLDLFGLPIQQQNTVVVGNESDAAISRTVSDISVDQEQQQQQVYPVQDAVSANPNAPGPAQQLGVVTPSNTLPFLTISGFPAERDMASMVLGLPEPATNVISKRHLPRLETPDKLIKFSVEHDKYKKKFSTHDSFSFFESATNQAFYGIRAFEEHSKVGRSNRIVIKDSNSEPFLLCRQKRNVNKKYVIHGRYPLHPTDASDDSEEGVPFYPWFMVRDIDDSHLNFRSVQIWNGRNYQPYLQIRNAKNPSKGQPLGSLRIPNKNDLRLTSSADHNRVYALFSRKLVDKGQEKVTGWDVCVAPGTDPGLCVALSLVLDDMVGWFA
mmetsp:Transcript_3198/g.6705  ORF Transcript_3198/g.6705 Transcript_3198/m.6705 type:complete len:475 (-) Transcript_3198:85-1509(-)